MIKSNDLKLSYKLNNKMKEETSYKEQRDCNIVKIIEKKVEQFKNFLFHFTNEEMSKFILPDYNLKSKLEVVFLEKNVKYNFIDDTKETLKSIFDILFDRLVTDRGVSITGFIEIIIASNQDLDFDNCEVEPQISKEGRIIQSYDFIFGDSQYSKFVDINKKAKNDIQSIIDKIIKNEESFKGEVISLIDDTDNKLSAIINNYINN